ncbi:MAG: hypothetical protein ABDH66_06245 [Bacteroidia bacterium]
MTSIEIIHVGFAEESHWNDKRFRSIGLVTLLPHAHAILRLS